MNLSFIPILLTPKRQLLQRDGSRFTWGLPKTALPRKPLRTVRSSRDTLSADPHGGNPQDRTASPHDCPPQRTGSS
jgi:hypothetical protein